MESTTEKEVAYKDDTKIVYKCGCWESRLESPEDGYGHCSAHHRFIECDEWSRTCLCGATEK